MRRIPFHRPYITGEEIAGVVDSLESGWITTGPKVKRFEQDFASYVGAPHAVALNSCTAALHLALEAIGLGEGDEVITTPMTFAATTEVIRYFNARPVLVDIEPGTMNMDPRRFEQVAGEICARSGHRLRAVMPVHFAGHPCDMDPIMETARAHGLKVIEDAAHTLPASYKGRDIGSIGDITCFSFYATKTITTGEGGMATTSNEQYAERMRMMSLHGISKDAWKRYTAEGGWHYEIMAPGFKYNMTDMAAAMGIAQLGRAGWMLERRQWIARQYSAAFAGTQALETPTSSPDVLHSWHLYPLRLNLDALTIDRNAFIEDLKERGIGTSVHFIPIHLHPYYRQTYGYEPEDFPVANAMYERIISLPIYPAMTDEDVQYVIDGVLEAARRSMR